MGKLFTGLKTEGLEKQEDRVGGGYSPFDTDAYDATITLAYAGESAKGAKNVTVHAQIGDREYRETIYITNKKGENWWTNDNGKKVPLPGFSVMNNICLVCTEKELEDQDAEEKIVKLYDFEERKELPKTVHVLTDLIGKPVTLGIRKTLENKNVLQGDSYVPSADTREVNNIEQVFESTTKMTVNEATANEGWDADKAEFYSKWVEKNQGKTNDKRKIKDGEGGTTGRPGASAGAPAEGGGARKSLFNKG